mgnify:CR=1 FL=1
MRLFYFFLFLCGIGRCWSMTEPHDSLINFAYIQKIHIQHPDYALQLLDSAEQNHLPGLQSFEIDMLRTMCYEIKGEQILNERYVRRALTSDSVRLVPSRKLNMLTKLINSLVTQGKNEEALGYSREALDLARQLGKTEKEAFVYFDVGRMYKKINLMDEALKCYRQGIDLIKDSENVRVMADLSYAYGELMAILMEVGHLEEAIGIGEKRVKLIARMSEKPGPPPGYIDSQYGYAYSKLAYALMLAGQKKEAEGYYRRFMQTDFAASRDEVGQIIPYLLQAGRYEEALRINRDDMASFQKSYGEDTVNYGYWIILDRFAQAYRGLQDYKQADAYQQRVTWLYDSIFSREQRSRAHEYATVFRLHEKDLQIANAKTEMQRRNFLLGGLSLLLVFLIAFSGIIWYNLRVMRRRNRVAVKQIDELMAKREEVRNSCCQKDEVLQPVSPEFLENTVQLPEQPDAGENNINKVEYERFLRLENAVIKDRLFLQPNFGRDELMELGSIGKNDLPRILRKYANADNVSIYLNRLRVEYAIKLMKEKPYLSFDAISKEASFNSHSTFYRAFYKVCGMTPAQYMKAQGEKNDPPSEA